MSPDMKTWEDATERVALLLLDGVEQLEKALAEMSHLNVIRRFMYSTNAAAQYIRWVWIASELTTVPPYKSPGAKYGHSDVSELYELIRVADHINTAEDLLGIMKWLDMWMNGLKEAAYTVKGKTLPEYKPGLRFNPDALAFMRNMLGDIIRVPTVNEARYECDQVPALNTRVLNNDDNSVYLADKEDLTGKPVGEVALIAGARLDRMHSSTIEKMDDAMGADYALDVGRLRLSYNTAVVTMAYQMKLERDGIETEGIDDAEKIGYKTTGKGPAELNADQRIA